VGIDPDTVRELKAHRRRQMADQAKVGDAWPDTGHVFTTGLGDPIYPDTVTQLMGKVIRAYNTPDPADPTKAPATPLPHARLHDLRHVHATLLLIAGVPVHVVAERLGHAEQTESEETDDDEGPEASALVPS
jgi:integrase